MNTLPEVWHLCLSLWVDDPQAASRAHPTAMGRLKEAVMSKGVNSRGWRLYLDYGDAIFDQLGRPWTHSGQSSRINEVNALAFLRLLQACETDVLPPVALLRSMARWEIPDQRLDLIPPAFFRAAWRMCVVAEYTKMRIPRHGGHDSTLMAGSVPASSRTAFHADGGRRSILRADTQAVS